MKVRVRLFAVLREITGQDEVDVELVPGTPLDRPLFWQVNRLAATELAALTRSVAATAQRALERA